MIPDEEIILMQAMQLFILRHELAASKAREKELRQRTIAHLEETENLLILEGTVKRLIEEMIS